MCPARKWTTCNGRERTGANCFKRRKHFCRICELFELGFFLSSCMFDGFCVSSGLPKKESSILLTAGARSYSPAIIMTGWINMPRSSHPKDGSWRSTRCPAAVLLDDQRWHLGNSTCFQVSWLPQLQVHVVGFV